MMSPDELRRIRADLGLTQVELGARLGVSGLAVSYWETGRRKISPPVALLLRRIRRSGGYLHCRQRRL